MSLDKPLCVCVCVCVRARAHTFSLGYTWQWITTRWSVLTVALSVCGEGWLSSAVWEAFLTVLPLYTLTCL